MSFSSDLKEELSKISNLNKKDEVKYELIGYLISKNTTVVKNSIRYATESEYNINRFSKLLRNLDIDNNIHIEYPYFNQSNIDHILYNYLKKYMYDNKNFNSNLFIDYDYFELEDEKYQLIMYVYEEKDVIVRYYQKNFIIDVSLGKVLEQGNIRDVDLGFDTYPQDLIIQEKPMVALTFDDGPNHNTGKILEILERYGVKATFFILGSNIKGNESLIKRMDSLGMELGNHMYSHRLLTKMEDDDILEEVKKVDDSIFDIVGKYPTLIRPSYGTYNKRIQTILDRPIIIWSVDTLDWKYHNSKKIFNRVIKGVKDGSIILMHDIYNATANSLEFIIPDLLEKGYQFVTVSELFYYKNISVEKGKVYGKIK